MFSKYLYSLTSSPNYLGLYTDFSKILGMQNNRLQNDERRGSKTLKMLTQFIFWNSKNLNVLEKSKPSNLYFFCNSAY